MSILTAIKGWFAMLFTDKAKEEFNIEPICSYQMDEWISECVDIYKGNPSWLNSEDNIDTVNFAKAICSETARLAMMGAGIHIDGAARGEWLQQQIDKVYYQLRNWIEYGCAYGTVILKPNGNTIDLYTREQFEIIHATGDKIDSVVFFHQKKVGSNWYTRMEYHRFEDSLYVITNKCYVGKSLEDVKKPVDISLTPWDGMAEEARLVNVTEPLFGVLRMPQANNIDLDSPYGMPVFSEAIQELRDLDIAYSRNAKEISDSKRTVLLDSDALILTGQRVSASAAGWARHRESLGLPDMVKNVRGDGKEMFYQEINPELRTDTRLEGINALLSQIGYKVGFSNGYFVFNERNGIQTATGVEAEQQRTIQFIKDIRDKLECCLNGLIYALNVFADLYNYAPRGAYEVVYDFGDITYNRDEDRSRWWGYVQAGKVPAWKFFVKFEGMTEEDAKAMVAEAQPKAPTLFGGEE
jgi:A118 family predicted phage portal protein